MKTCMQGGMFARFAIAAIVPGLMFAGKARADYNFQTLNSAKDVTFNQLLGINNSGQIAGYFGIGSAGHPNQGYTIMPPYSQGSYTYENFPGSVQTQVTGLNNSGVNVGFYADANNNNFGFVDKNGTFTAVIDPNTPNPTPGTPSGMNQLLGINDHGIAAGFYLDAAGNTHGYLYNTNTSGFTAVNVIGAVSVTATGINNNGVISGFYSTGGQTFGFLLNGSQLTSFEQTGSTNTMFLGVNNNGLAVGTFMDANGIQHGIEYDVATGKSTIIDDPLGLGGTVLNGINDKGQLVGFYTDAAGNVDGVLATPVPEPASMTMALIGMGLCGFRAVKNRLKARSARPE